MIFKIMFVLFCTNAGLWRLAFDLGSFTHKSKKQALIRLFIPILPIILLAELAKELVVLFKKLP